MNWHTDLRNTRRTTSQAAVGSGSRGMQTTVHAAHLICVRSWTLPKLMMPEPGNRQVEVPARVVGQEVPMKLVFIRGAPIFLYLVGSGRGSAFFLSTGHIWLRRTENETTREKVRERERDREFRAGQRVGLQCLHGISTMGRTLTQNRKSVFTKYKTCTHPLTYICMARVLFKKNICI